MISLLLYGRNDAHGYNLHRRAALSLNCLAETLTDPDDEIIFVDFNTPDELPTFVEALSDTLTERCLRLLRVLRVPAAIHGRQFGALTHLPAIEPVSRNAAARRANPANRWLLSTNTDMILLPAEGTSMSSICEGLPDGYYGLPRFEIPEWLWERLPRSDPAFAMRELARLGPALRLDESTVAHEWIRFDAPGDFQLCLRDDFWAIDGFDEEMLLGWHVDSNFSRRMLLHRGRIDSLGDRIAGYHCNHSRTPTVYHADEGIANDLARFYFTVEHHDLPAQRERWGLAEQVLEEIPVSRRATLSFADALVSAIPAAEGPRLPSNTLEAAFELSYDSGHVLPFVADSIAVSRPDARIAYLGANPVLAEGLAGLVTRLGLEHPLRVTEIGSLKSIQELARTADVVVVDLGIDVCLIGSPESGESELQEPGTFPARLREVLDAFELLVDAERERLELGEHPRRFVLVNSATAFSNAYVAAHLHCSHTSMHSRVRRATVKRIPNEDEAMRVARRQSQRSLRWRERRDLAPGRLELPLGRTIAIGDVDDFRGFGEGWAAPDTTAIWTQGRRATLTVGLPQTDQGCYLALAIGRIGVLPGESLRFALRVDDRQVAACEVERHRPDRFERTWRVDLPPGALTALETELSLVIEEPLAWSLDERELGLQLVSLSVRKDDWRRTVDVARERAGRHGLAARSRVRRLIAGAVPAADEASRLEHLYVRRLERWPDRHELAVDRLRVRVGKLVEIAELVDLPGFGAGWATPDRTAIWTQGQRAELALSMPPAAARTRYLTLTIGRIGVGSDESLRVRLLLDGIEQAARSFEKRTLPVTWRVELPDEAARASKADLTFAIERPLAWSRDDRCLGIHLQSIGLQNSARRGAGPARKAQRSESAKP